MKKICLFLLCSFSTFACGMELQHKKEYSIKHEEDLTEIPLQPLQKIPLTANELGWEKLNDIALYKEPVTEYINTWVKKTSKEENNQLSTQLDHNRMQQLYNQANTFIKKYHSTETAATLRNPDLILLLKNMHEANQNDINEDMISNFIYKNYHENFYSHYYKQRAILLFYCLKRYRLQKTINEQLPPENHCEEKYKPITKNIKSKLAQTLDLNITETVSANPNYWEKNSFDNAFKRKYPAYYQLSYDIRELLKEKNQGSVNAIVSCFYNDETQWLKPSSQGIYNNLNRDFYVKSNNVLCGRGIRRYRDYVEETYDLLQIIQNAKTSKDILEEKDLAISILTQKTMPLLDYFFEIKQNNNKVIILCALLEKYNKKRQKKKTPTPQQLFYYETLTDTINIAFPDSFNKTLFDKNHYAFEEFKQLIEDINILNNSSAEDIQKCVTALYGKES